jgi:hypothetical protein
VTCIWWCGELRSPHKLRSHHQFWFVHCRDDKHPTMMGLETIELRCWDLSSLARCNEHNNQDTTSVWESFPCPPMTGGGGPAGTRQWRRRGPHLDTSSGGPVCWSVCSCMFHRLGLRQAHGRTWCSCSLASPPVWQGVHETWNFWTDSFNTLYRRSAALLWVVHNQHWVLD